MVDSPLSAERLRWKREANPMADGYGGKPCNHVQCVSLIYDIQIDT